MRARRVYGARIAAIAESLELFDRGGVFGP
jgi:hypothetical protein